MSISLRSLFRRRMLRPAPASSVLARRNQTKLSLSRLEARDNPGGDPKTAVLGDFVWWDQNSNGLQDAGEPGVATKVSLLNGSGAVIGTTTSNANGLYLFSNLTGGNYKVQFDLPADFTFTAQNVGSNGKVDSDPNPATGITGVITLAPGATNLTIDAGLVKKEPPKKGALGDYVWFDVNANGLQDPGEPGVENITVNLLDASSNVIKTQKTNSNGLYLFDNLDAGNYRVQFIKNLATDSYTLFRVGNDPKIDSDADPATGITPLVSLAAGEINLTIDCGLIKPPPPPKPSSIRGLVYCDENQNGVFDNGDHGIGSVKITLTGIDSQGSKVSRVLYTGADGSYLFTGLPAGTFVLTETQPVGFEQGTNKAGSAGGVVVGDSIVEIPIVKGIDAYGYLFGEKCPDGGHGNKEDLLASSKNHMPTLADMAKYYPTSPTYSNSVAVTKLGNPSIVRYAATGQGIGGSRVRVFDYTTGKDKFDFIAYPGFGGGVRVAVADVTGDGVPDIITAPGAGGGPHIKVFSGVNGQLVSQFYAYVANLTTGVYVAAGDVNGDGVSEIITAAGEGGGPHVRIFNAAGQVQREFYAYAASMTSGVRVATGDVNGDGRTDIITVPGAGAGSHVRIFSGNPAQGILNEWFAYGGGFSGGVFIAAGDVDGDGKADVVTGPGAGGGPDVRTFRASDPSHPIINEFYAYEANFLGGVRVGALDINGDGKADIITAPASKLPTVIQVRDAARNAYMEAFLGFDVSYTGGAFVTGGTRRNLPESLGG